MTVEQDDGSNNSMYNGIAIPEVFHTPEALASQLETKNCEFYNPKRLHVALSLCAGALQNMDRVLRDGNQREIYHDSLIRKWAVAYDKYGGQNTLAQLNTEHYPSEVRTEESVKAAVQKILLWSNSIRQEWDFWSEIFYRSSCLYVDSYWALTLGTLTETGCYAEKVGCQPVLAHKEYATLMQKPTVIKKLFEFITAEVLAGTDLRKKRGASFQPAGAKKRIKDLNFDLSSDVTDGNSTEDPDEKENLEMKVAAVKAWRAGSKKLKGYEAKKSSWDQVWKEATEALTKYDSEDVISAADLRALGKAKKSELAKFKIKAGE